MATPVLAPMAVVNNYFLEAPRWTDQRVLAAGTAAAVTVPTGAKSVIFGRESGSFRVAYSWGGETPVVAIAASDVSDGTGSEANPEARHIANVTAMSLISAAGATVTMSFFE